MRRAIVAALPVAGAAAVAGVLLGGSRDEPTAARAQASGASATVERRTLTERQRVDGELGYAGERTVLNRLAGTITWMPAEGTVVRPGQRLFEVDGDPVVLMDGRVPAYRRLAAGVSDGPDVRQLERGLRDLGHDPGTVDDDFDASTAAAVRRWQESRGLRKTGAIELGRIVFLPGARRVADVKADLGSTAAGGSGGGGGRSDVSDGASGAAGSGRQFASLTTADETGGTPGSPSGSGEKPQDGENPNGSDKGGSDGCDCDTGGEKQDGGDGAGEGERPRASDDQRERPQSGAGQSGGGQSAGAGGMPAQHGGGGTSQPQGGGAGEAGGGGGDGGGGDGGVATEVMTTTSTRRVATVALDAADQQIAREGARVDVELPDGRRVKGRIARVGRVAQTAGDGDDAGGGGGGGDGAATVSVTVSIPRDRVRGLDRAPVSVELARETRRNVLVVPVTALVARRGGGYAVEVISATGRRLVAVTPGIFADGLVEVDGRGLREGQRVAVPQQ